MQKSITRSMILVLCLFGDMLLFILFWLWWYVWFMKLESVRICFGTYLFTWLSWQRCLYYICHYFRLMILSLFRVVCNHVFNVILKIIIDFVHVHYICLTCFPLKYRLHHGIFKCFINRCGSQLHLKIKRTILLHESFVE